MKQVGQLNLGDDFTNLSQNQLRPEIQQNSAVSKESDVNDSKVLQKEWRNIILKDHEGMANSGKPIHFELGETPAIRLKKMIASDANQIKMVYGMRP